MNISGETISGAMTKSEQVSIRLMGVLFSLMCGAPILGFGVLEFFVPKPDRGTQIAALALGPLVFVFGIVLTRWLQADWVVEFAFDGSLFRFRKVGSDHVETRALSDIAKVSRETRRSGLWYRVVFRDGAQAALSCHDLPNAEVVTKWLSRSQGG